MTVDNSTTPLKRCNKCGRELPADDMHFYVNRGALCSPCKECKGYRFGRRSDIYPQNGFKVCPTCKRTLELTSDNFYPNPSAKSGFHSQCRSCHNKASAKWRKANPDKAREQSYRWAQANPEKTREIRKRYRQRNPERYREYKRQQYRDNPDKVNQRNRQWQQANPETYRESHRRATRKWEKANPDKVREAKLRWMQANPDKMKEMSRRNIERNRKKRYKSTAQWRKENPEKIREQSRRWRKANPEKMRVKDLNRKARKRSLPDTLTRDQWRRAVEYFNGCCAVCGRQANDLFGAHTLAADHWIPLTSPDCAGTIATNIVPLCHSREVGAGGCNGSKRNSDPTTWLQRKFPKKWRVILARIETYFEWVREQDGE